MRIALVALVVTVVGCHRRPDYGPPTSHTRVAYSTHGMRGRSGFELDGTRVVFSRDLAGRAKTETRTLAKVVVAQVIDALEDARFADLAGKTDCPIDDAPAIAITARVGELDHQVVQYAMCTDEAFAHLEEQLTALTGYATWARD